ncbi:MAG: C25 family peptidase propeptide domain-containing protein, partial [Planctomycetota bacterium]
MKCNDSRIYLLSFSLFLFAAMALVGALPATAQEMPEKVSCSFSFDAPRVKAIEHDGASYASIMVPGALTLGRTAGEPALPVSFVQILLPPGKEPASIMVTGDSSLFTSHNMDLRESPVFPYQEPIPIGSKPVQKLKMNPQIYASENAFPAQEVGGVQVGDCRGYTIVSMGLSLVKYTPATGELAWFPGMTVDITLK